MILEDEVSLMVIFSLLLEFSATNNQVEYEAVIVKLTLAAEVGEENFKFRTNLQLFFLKSKGRCKPSIHFCDDI